MISRELETAAVELGSEERQWFVCPHHDSDGHEFSARVVARSYRLTRRGRVFVSAALEDDTYTSALKREVRETAAEHAVAAVERQLKLTDLRRIYESRIEFLREAAEEDELVMNETPVDEFWRFFDEFEPIGRASLVLILEGDLRAIWRTGPENHIGIHFKGDGTVHYVVFKRMLGSDTVTRTSGACTLSEVAELISRYRMGRLVFG